MTHTFDVLRDILVKDYELSAERLTPETTLADIELDSLSLTELIFELEDQFSVIATHNGAGLNTLADVANYIDGLVATRDGAPSGPSP
jgi:acyl carrier protein